MKRRRKGSLLGSLVSPLYLLHSYSILFSSLLFFRSLPSFPSLVFFFFCLLFASYILTASLAAKSAFFLGSLCSKCSCLDGSHSVQGLTSEPLIRPRSLMAGNGFQSIRQPLVDKSCRLLCVFHWFREIAGNLSQLHPLASWWVRERESEREREKSEKRIEEETHQSTDRSTKCSNRQIGWFLHSHQIELRGDESRRLSDPVAHSTCIQIERENERQRIKERREKGQTHDQPHKWLGSHLGLSLNTHCHALWTHTLSKWQKNVSVSILQPSNFGSLVSGLLLSAFGHIFFLKL